MKTSLLRVVLASIVLVIILAACGGEPEYSPDAATIAARENQEYQASVRRRGIVVDAAIVLLVAAGAVLIYWVYKLGETRYRVESAKAASVEADARRKRLVDLGGGKVLELIPGDDGRGVIHGTTIQVPSAVLPVTRAEPIARQEQQGEPLAVFVLDAANIAGWASKTFPHWRKWKADEEGKATMTGETWYRNTNELVEMGLLDPKHDGKQTTVAGGHDLLWVHNQLT